MAGIRELACPPLRCVSETRRASFATLHALVSQAIELEPGLRALWRWKWLVLAGALVAAAIAAGVTMLGPDVFRTSALVEVGRVMGEPLEDPFAVAELVESAGFQQAAGARAGGARVAGRVEATAVTGGQGRAERPVFVRVTATGTTPEEAVRAGQAAVDELLARHRDRYAKAEAAWRETERLFAEASASRDLGEVRAKLASPTTTAETRLTDAFPVPASPITRNTAATAAVAFAVALAILSLLALAVGSVRR